MRLKALISLAPTILIGHLFVSPLSGQSLDDLLQLSLEDLANVEITTATRSQKPIKELSSMVHIITRKEILNNNYLTLVDALSQVPSVRTARPGTGSLGEKYFIRGLSGNDYAKILINGVPIRPSVVDGMPLGEQIDMRSIERIEVVFGPASALYGADAMAGIINIVPYSPEHNATLVEGSLGTSDGAVTRHGGGKFFMHHVKDNIKISVHGGFSDKDDLNVVKNSKDFSDASIYNINTKFGQMPSKSHYFGLGISFADFRLCYDNMYRVDHSSLEQNSDFYVYDNSQLLYGETIQKASLNHKLEMNQVKLISVVSYLRYRLDTQSAFGLSFYSTPLYKYQASDDILWEETMVYGFTKNLEILGGVSFQYSGAMPKTSDLTKPLDGTFYKPFSKDIPQQGVYQSALFGNFGFKPITYYNLGSFIQMSYSVKSFIVTGGIRFDDHSEYESTLNPRVSGLFHLDKTSSVYASYNESYRAPTPYKVYDAFGYDNGDGTVTYSRVPNEALQPEKFRAYEGGFRKLVSSNLSLELAGYRHETTGLISVGNVTIDTNIYPNATQAKTEAESNLNSSNGKSILNGLDLIASFTNIYQPARLNAQVYFSYAMGEEALPNGGSVEVYRNSPEFLTKLRLQAHPLPNLYIGVDNVLHGQWYAKLKKTTDLSVPENKSEGYYTADIISNYRFHIKAGELKAFFKINNVFDQTYGGVRLKDNPQYQRSYYIGFDFLM